MFPLNLGLIALVGKQAGEPFLNYLAEITMLEGAIVIPKR